MPRPASRRRPTRSPLGFALEREPGDVLRRQVHGVAIVGLRQLAHHQRRVGDGARHRPGDAAAEGGSIGTRPRLGFSPKMPHQPAGSRIEPPMSVPMWSGP